MPSRNAPDLGQAISAWQNHMDARDLAPTTRRAYVDAAMLLVHAFGTHCDPTTITLEDLEAIMATWRKLEGTTRRNRVVAWRQFWKWGQRRHGWPDTAGQLEIPRRSKPAIRRLTAAEVEALLAANTVERARTVVWFLAYTAVRIGELIEMTWRDIDLVAARVTVSHTTAKGRKGRIVPMPDELVRYLAAVKDSRGDQHTADDCYLIPHRRRAQFIPENEATIWTQGTSQMSIGRILKAAGAQARVRAPQELTAHMLRRYYLEHVLDRGMGMYVAKAIAGHASIQTTAEYGGGASIEATTRAVRGLSFASAREGSDGRTWVRTKGPSQQRRNADETEPIEPLRPDSGGGV